MQAHYIAADFLMLALLTACTYHAYTRHNLYRVSELFATLIYGVVLESIAIIAYQDYTYGKDFLIIIAGLPIAVGIGWAVIIYSAMELSNSLRLSEWVRPLLDTILALSIDLSMDPIAIRMGYWNYVVPHNSDWFGVPAINYFGWISIAFTYSYWTRAARRIMQKRAEDPSSWKKAATHLTPMLVVVPSILTLLVMRQTWTGLTNLKIPLMLIPASILTVVSIITITDAYKQKNRGFIDKKIDLIPFLVPLAINIFYLLMAVAFGFFSNSISLGIISGLTLIINLLVYSSPWIVGKTKKPETSQSNTL